MVPMMGNLDVKELYFMDVFVSIWQIDKSDLVFIERLKGVQNG